MSLNLKEKTFLALILARAGSKRLKNKNILKLANKPLVAHSIEAALKSKYITKTLLSSDSDEILAIGKEHGAFVIKRPLELATDSATSFETAKHAIENFKNFDYIVLLQPTSPLRLAKHIDEAIELLASKNADAVVSLTQAKHPKEWINRVPNDDNLENFLDKKNQKRSQEFQNQYQLNGAIYICNREKFLQEKTFFLAQNIYAYKMDKKSSVDIDEEIDFLLAQTILDQQ